jgi:hypothetical protein
VPTLFANNPNKAGQQRFSGANRNGGQAQPSPFYYVPVPLSATVCGLAPPLSPTSSVAVFCPLVLGVKVTLIVQLPPAGTLVPQLLVWAKDGEFFPVMRMP